MSGTVERAADLAGIAEADALLGRPFPLPRCPLPLVRWVEVRALAAGAEVAWNLDDSRRGTPGRLALYAGPVPPPDQLAGVTADSAGARLGEHEIAVRRIPLDDAQPSLRPVVELVWAVDGLFLRLTGQGPWALDELLAVASSVGVEALDGLG